MRRCVLAPAAVPAAAEKGRHMLAARPVQMTNLIRDWHCFLGDEPKDVDREIRWDAHAPRSCAPVAPRHVRAPTS